MRATARRVIRIFPRLALRSPTQISKPCFATFTKSKPSGSSSLIFFGSLSRQAPIPRLRAKPSPASGLTAVVSLGFALNLGTAPSASHSPLFHNSLSDFPLPCSPPPNSPSTPPPSKVSPASSSSPSASSSSSSSSSQTQQTTYEPFLSIALVRLRCASTQSSASDDALHRCWPRIAKLGALQMRQMRRRNGNSHRY